MPARLNIIGKQFGRLKVLADAPSRRVLGGKPKRLSLCVCDCGITCEIRNGDLASGKSKSCGCLQREITGARCLTHGEASPETRTTEYCSWASMKSRCLNSNDESFKDYGGRGITVCEKWMSFELFLSDMGRKPTSKHMIERRDNELGYCPDNCYWATRGIQNRNKRNNILLTLDGRTQIISDWAKEFGLFMGTLRHRLKRGWPLKEALTVRPRGGNNKP